jgi:integrase
LRFARPFLRGKRGIYYCWVNGHLKSLRTKKPRIAESRHTQLLTDWKEEQKRLTDLAQDVTRPKAWTVRECFDHYLEHAATMKPNTLRNRQQILGRFCNGAEVGKMPTAELTVDHLEAWIRHHSDWSSSMRRSVINYVMAAFNFCVKRRKIDENPIHGISKPRWERRKEVISRDDEQSVYNASTGAFRDILTVLRSCGARPNELCSAKLEHYSTGVITLSEHKVDDSGEVRTIYLTSEAMEVVERLICGRTEGFIFLNSQGRAWKPDTLYCRFKRMRKDLGLGEGVFPYSLRAKFTSDAINNENANPTLIAKSLGHSNLNMLLRHYLKEDPESVRKALEEVVRK